MLLQVSPRPSSSIIGEHEEPGYDFLDLHLQSTETETLLMTLKLVLSRLMAHPTYNRKEKYNSHVDYLDFRLKYYTSIVKINGLGQYQRYPPG